MDITVNSINDAPTTTPVTLMPISEFSDGRVITQADLLGNAEDIDGDALTAIGLTIENGNGTLVDNGDGTWSYTPAANDTSDVSFKFDITDGTEVVEGTATLDITAANVGLFPTDINGTEDVLSAIDLSLIDLSDVDDTNLTLVIDAGIGTLNANTFQGVTISGSGTNSLTLEGTVSNLNALLNDTSVITYLGSTNLSGDDVDTISVNVATDGGPINLGTANIDLAAVNDAPIGADDAFAVNEDTALRGDVISNSDADIDTGDILSATLVSGPANADTFTLNPDGSFEYVPIENFNGNDTFVYQIADGNGGFDTATVNIKVRPVNDLPDAVNDSIQIILGQDSTAVGNVLLNDMDVDGDALMAFVQERPNNGTVTFDTAGNFVYQPNPGFTGVDSFTYRSSDSVGTVITTVEIEVTSIGVVIQGPEENIAPVEAETTIIEEPISEEEVNESSEEEDEDNNLAGSALLASGLNKVPILNLTERTEFQADGDAQDLLKLLTDRSYARSVLSSILANSQSEEASELEQSSLLDEFNARNSGVQTVFNAGFLFEEIESQIDVEFDEFKFAVGAITSFSSLGYILWTLRGGALMAVAFAQMPSWRMIDPLPVLDSYSSAAADEDEEFGDFFG